MQPSDGATASAAPRAASLQTVALDASAFGASYSKMLSAHADLRSKIEEIVAAAASVRADGVTTSVSGVNWAADCALSATVDSKDSAYGALENLRSGLAKQMALIGESWSAYHQTDERAADALAKVAHTA